MEIILAIIFIHFVADFLCQTDNMALNKSKSLYWLGVHVLTYTAVLLFASFFLFFYLEGFKWTGSLWKFGLSYALVNGILHFVTDFFTSKLTNRLWHLESKHWFFVAIGFDQMIHYFCLFVSYEYLMEWLWPSRFILQDVMIGG